MMNLNKSLIRQTTCSGVKIKWNMLSNNLKIFEIITLFPSSKRDFIEYLKKKISYLGNQLNFQTIFILKNIFWKMRNKEKKINLIIILLLTFGMQILKFILLDWMKDCKWFHTCQFRCNYDGSTVQSLKKRLKSFFNLWIWNTIKIWKNWISFQQPISRGTLASTTTKKQQKLQIENRGF